MGLDDRAGWVEVKEGSAYFATGFWAIGEEEDLGT